TTTVALAPNEPFIRMDGSTLNATDFTALVRVGSGGFQGFDEAGVVLIATGGSHLNVAGNLLWLSGGNVGDTNPLIQLTDSTVTTGDSLIYTSNPMTVAGPLLRATRSTIDAPRLLLSQALFTGGEGADALLQFDSS